MKPSEIFKLIEEYPHTTQFKVTDREIVSFMDAEGLYEYTLEKMSKTIYLDNVNFIVEVKDEVPEWNCKVYSYTIDKVSVSGTIGDAKVVPVHGQNSISIPSLTTSSLNYLEAYAKLLAYIEDNDPDFCTDLKQINNKHVPQINVGKDSAHWALRTVKHCGYLGQVHMSKECAEKLIIQLREKKVNFGFEEEDY